MNKPTIVWLWLLFIATVGVSGALAPSLRAQGTCSLRGAIDADRTIGPSEGCTTYIVDGNINVLESATLFVEPGTTLRFNRGLLMTVAGSLRSSGTAAQPIRFTSSAASPTKGDWGGILWVYGSPAVIADCLGTVQGAARLCIHR